MHGLGLGPYAVKEEFRRLPLRVPTGVRGF